ncbi:MAG: FeoB-associated Cys-rich membrane protein [Prevotellaceae bacterium]|jgi:tetrahydromethanopterin S-methyltransferase subunit B|nr:FeoB-associated Cys-rich membrane protein [Prevotellaceae bacterium]
MGIINTISKITGEDFLLSELVRTRKAIPKLKNEIEELENYQDELKERIAYAQKSISNITGQPVPDDATATTTSGGSSSSNNALIIGLIVIVVMAFLIAKIFKKNK